MGADHTPLNAGRCVPSERAFEEWINDGDLSIAILRTFSFKLLSYPERVCQNFGSIAATCGSGETLPLSGPLAQNAGIQVFQGGFSGQ